ncbi:alternative ribosome rescue aminoacyl-tRNA hydrolase ArfB [Sinomonas mesophila]|uniref:alternative ribosome rescue aminoacyl-tRNA hydrolase ArfB n=1 Tax=Sinomonas mesophila TaxID=1531955 RepID=UPI001FEB63BA|nr:alternative ribosome rescue aminoacyl-tRNA hydrolase ArfB [Sinomonas mesophila]
MNKPGQDLRVPPTPGAPRGVVIPAAEIVERFSRSSGPGGQGVNTSDSRVELLFDPGASAAFSPVQRDRVLKALSGRLVGGRLSLVASGERSQLRNRESARERLVVLLSEALRPPAPTRRPTRPTRSSQANRLAAKKRRSDIKSSRRTPPLD